MLRGIPVLKIPFQLTAFLPPRMFESMVIHCYGATSRETCLVYQFASNFLLLVTWFEWTLSWRFLFSVLRSSLERLKRECHWLRAVSWQLCGQCKLCPGRVDPETKKCYWHQTTDCLHDDCAHYVPVNSSPFCCAYAKGPDFRISQTWIQVLKQTSLVSYLFWSCSIFFLLFGLIGSLRKLSTFRHATTGFPVKWRLRNERRNSILITRHYPDLGSGSDWLCREGYLLQPIKSTTQIWVVTRHQYGISAVVPQTSFRVENSDGVA